MEKHRHLVYETSTTHNNKSFNGHFAFSRAILPFPWYRSYENWFWQHTGFGSFQCWQKKHVTSELQCKYGTHPPLVIKNRLKHYQTDEAVCLGMGVCVDMLPIKLWQWFLLTEQDQNGGKLNVSEWTSTTTVMTLLNRKSTSCRCRKIICICCTKICVYEDMCKVIF